MAEVTNFTVPNFNGEKKESAMFEAKKFVNSCKLVTKLFGPKHQDELFQLCKNRLQGEAYEKILLNDAKNFAEMEEVLLRNYGQKKELYQLLRDLQTCKQMEDESLMDYLERFEKQYRLTLCTARDQYPEPNSDITDEVAKQTLLYGIRSQEISYFLMSKNDESVDTWLVEAAKLHRDRSHYESYNGANRSTETNLKEQHIDDNKPRVDVLRQMLQQIIEQTKGEENSYANQFKAGKCHECLGTNHNFKQCIQEARKRRAGIC